MKKRRAFIKRGPCCCFKPGLRELRNPGILLTFKHSRIEVSIEFLEVCLQSVWRMPVEATHRSGLIWERCPFENCVPVPVPGSATPSDSCPRLASVKRRQKQLQSLCTTRTSQELCSKKERSERRSANRRYRHILFRAEKSPRYPANSTPHLASREPRSFAQRE